MNRKLLLLLTMMLLGLIFVLASGWMLPPWMVMRSQDGIRESGPRGAYQAQMAVAAFGITWAFGLIAWAARSSMPLHLLPVPFKRAWVEAGREAEFRNLVADDLLVLGSMAQGLLVAVQVSVILANRRVPASPGPEVTVILVVFSAMVVGWICYRLATRYHQGLD